MSGKDRKPQTTQRRSVEPFDLARLAAGEALAVVYLEDGSRVEGRLDTTWMIVPLEPPRIVSPLARAKLAAKRAHFERVMTAGQLAAAGLGDPEIVAEMMRLGLLAASPYADDPDRIRSVKRWRSAFLEIPAPFRDLPPGTFVMEKVPGLAPGSDRSFPAE